MVSSFLIVALAFASVRGAPVINSRQASGFKLQNGKDAQALNAKFTSLTADSTCAAGDTVCIDGGFAQCVNGKFVITPCGGGLKCVALPLVNKAGTSITCDTEADAIARIAATGATGGLTGSAANTPATPADVNSSPVSPTATSTSGSPGGFKLQNGKDAQALNVKFATLTADSACNVGDNACINGGFAQCVAGKFVVTGCAGGLTCFALPLVNKAGTSLVCDTEADALARIAATGAEGGLTGSGSTETGATEPAETPAPPIATAATPAATAGGDFRVQNGKDAQALNAKFATLNADSACNTGDNACIDGGFAQCVAGKFVVTPCAGGLICVGLPLVNKPGTSITCDTKADALARITASGATGGLTG